MKTSAFSIFLASIFIIALPASDGKELPKIAVWDLVPREVKGTYAQELTSILVSEIAKLKNYEVYSQDNVRTLAGWTAERMTLGCTDTKCLTALGQMDIAKLISGSVGKIGNRYSISLNLFDTQKAKAENAVSEFCRTEDELIELVQQAARKLLGTTIESTGTVGKVVEKPKIIRAQEKCEAPNWNTGDKWTYKGADGRTWMQNVVRVEEDLYILDIGSKDRWGFDKNTMNIKFLIQPGDKRKNFKGWRGKIFNFPIHIGKTWEDSYASVPDEGTDMVFYVNEFKVESFENVATPAGVFQAYKIYFLQTNKKSNRSGWINWWYSPQVKNYVRRQVGGPPNYWPRGMQNQELISYELK